MAQPTTPAELVVHSDVVTAVTPVKFSKPAMVCRVNTMDWSLMLSVVSERPDILKASRSEDIGGVKLAGAEADDLDGGVVTGINEKVRLAGDAVAEMLYVPAIVLGVPARV